MLELALAFAAAIHGPAAPVGPAVAAPTDPAPSAGEQSALDVHALLGEDTKAYLAARARLGEHPVEAAEAILDRLAVIPAPTDSDKKRLLDVLAELGGSEHVQLFIDELRRGLKAADTTEARDEVLERWLPLLRAQGDAARAPLTALVGDRELPLSVRGRLLETVVETSEAQSVAALVVLIGRGHRALRETLVRALARRAKPDPATRQRLLTRIDAEIEQETDPKRAPSLLWARTTLTTDPDPAFVGKLAGLATDDDAHFGVRVAAVRGLARDASPPALEALEALADAQLQTTRRQTQAGEILAWLSLQGLPAERTASLSRTHALREADAPRLAALAWSVGDVAADQAWLPRSQLSPWPQVRQAALDRVDGQCTPGTNAFLGKRATKGTEPEPAVARATVTAIGRCGDWDTLTRLMNDDDVHFEQRTEAARQLAKRGGARGADAVAAAIAKGPDRRMARRLTAALRHVPTATPAVVRALCRTAQREDEVGTEATQSLLALDVDPAERCS
jgi:hypothetical protein